MQIIEHLTHYFLLLWSRSDSRSKRLEASFVFVYYLINNKDEIILKRSKHESDRGLWKILANQSQFTFGEKEVYIPSYSE